MIDFCLIHPTNNYSSCWVDNNILYSVILIYLCHSLSVLLSIYREVYWIFLVIGFIGRVDPLWPTVPNYQSTTSSSSLGAADSLSGTSLNLCLSTVRLLLVASISSCNAFVIHPSQEYQLIEQALKLHDQCHEHKT